MEPIKDPETVLSNVTDMLLGEGAEDRSYKTLLLGLERLLAVVNAARMDHSPTTRVQRALDAYDETRGLSIKKRRWAVSVMASNHFHGDEKFCDHIVAIIEADNYPEAINLGTEYAKQFFPEAKGWRDYQCAVMPTL